MHMGSDVPHAPGEARRRLTHAPGKWILGCSHVKWEKLLYQAAKLPTRKLYLSQWHHCGPCGARRTINYFDSHPGMGRPLYATSTRGWQPALAAVEDCAPRSRHVSQLSSCMHV